MSDLSVVSLSF